MMDYSTIQYEKSVEGADSVDGLTSASDQMGGSEHQGKPEGFANQRLLVLPATLAGVLGHALVSPFYVTDIGCFPHAGGHYRERPEGSEGHIAILCVDGKGWVQSADAPRQVVPSSSLVLLRRGTPHAYGADTESPWTVFWFHFAGYQADVMMPYLLKGARSCAVLPVTSETATRAVTLFEEAYAQFEQGFSLHHVAYGAQIVLHLLGLICLQHPLWTAESPLRDANRINRAVDLMQSRLEESVTLQELADTAELSKSRFHEVFRNVMGTPPVEYYLRLKMQRACQYLDLTNWSVRRVAEAVGVPDPYYFSRVFRKLIGVSPTRYREVPKG